MRRILDNWRTHGVPRCTGYRDGRLCFRLLWPWFDLGGNGESVLCRECSDAFHSRTWDDEDAALWSIGLEKAG